MIKKFKVTAIRTDEYIIELDEEKFNDEWKKAFGSVFHDIDCLEDVVRDLAFHQLRMGSEGSGRFIEGYGPVNRNGKLPFSYVDYEDGKELPEDKRQKAAEGINIVIIDEDEEYDFDIEPIEDEEAVDEQN